MNITYMNYCEFNGIDENSVSLVCSTWGEEYDSYHYIGETILDWIRKEHITLPCIVRLPLLNLENRLLSKVDNVRYSLYRAGIPHYCKMKYWSVDYHDVVLRFEEYGIQDI